MIPSLLEDMKIENLIRQENLPQICSAADRLRRHAQAAPQGFDPASLELLDGLLTAAAEAEQTLALQRARIRSRSEEHTSELQSLMRISYAVFCLTKKKHNNTHTHTYA